VITTVHKASLITSQGELHENNHELVKNFQQGLITLIPSTIHNLSRSGPLCQQRHVAHFVVREKKKKKQILKRCPPDDFKQEKTPITTKSCCSCSPFQHLGEPELDSLLISHDINRSNFQQNSSKIHVSTEHPAYNHVSYASLSNSARLFNHRGRRNVVRPSVTGGE
jgi:hypothetical protein